MSLPEGAEHGLEKPPRGATIKIYIEFYSLRSSELSCIKYRQALDSLKFFANVSKTQAFTYSAIIQIEYHYTNSMY